MLSTLWEFRVRPERAAEFESAYSSRGAWAALFAKNDGFLGTTLLRDASAPGRYLTIDRWLSGAAHAAMRERHAAEYETLDRAFEALTRSEIALGTFEEVE
ncbi:MAG: antibiotic biosynthesis monooxygenase [Candidatus Acidiferrales bacterium]